jgi:hypothetical protein
MPSNWKFWTKGKESKGLTEAREMRAESAQSLELTERQRAIENIRIVQPLRRTRQEMLHKNHVTEEVVRLLREGGR